MTTDNSFVPLREAALLLGLGIGYLRAQAELGYVTAKRTGRGGRRLLFDPRLLDLELRSLAALSPQRTALAGLADTARFLGVEPGDLRALAGARLVPSFEWGPRLLFDTDAVHHAVHARGGNVRKLLARVTAEDRRGGGEHG